MGSGNLIIQVRTSENALPISGVMVRIKNQEGTVLYDLITDENGETEEIKLDAVSRELSLDPSFTGIPYTSYELDAKAAGYNNLEITDVQIFDGENAIQPIRMIPMLEGQLCPLDLELFMGKQALRMTEPRIQIGSDVEPFIFRQVIIPNPITVHLGVPAASATNVQVSFTDYVKNVASSEIYPTWPTAALEANIYAIITFALNRVFTQWYRSRGFNFDITNSTAYDQYFVYGRTIYQSISLIVDKIFNQYVRRQGQNAPFFTSFCNGTTATCAGLSQWGTVTLANNGQSSLDILRHYYPKDIEIAQTDIITDIVVSYPGTPLKLGSIGADVEAIQLYLLRIRRNYPAIPFFTDELGTFGNSTKSAVTKFQSIFGLTPDGIVGKATWNKISFVFVAVTNLASLETEGTTLGIGTVPPSSVLQMGSSGIDVITLQYILAFISDFYPSIPAPSQNGIFGNDTYLSVIAFQQMMGLSNDGIVGPSTWLSLYDTYWGIRNNVEFPDPDPDQHIIEYIVQAGDTLWLIAQRFQTTVAAIKALNKLTTDVLKIGQLLLVPIKGTKPPTNFSYTVRSGDTLWLLSQRFNVTIIAIKTLNNLTSDVLQIGQILLIPSM